MPANPRPRPPLRWPAPYPGAHWLDHREERAVADVIRRRSLFRYYGVQPPRYVASLEAAAREYYGVRHALAVNSGTGALTTAMTALEIGPGAEVIVPAFLWVSTVGAVVQANAIPVLCEVDDSFCLAPDDLERHLTPRTRLIIAVHMAGAVCDMDRIMRLARRHRITVFEDCAQANGGSFRGRKVGTFGRLGMFSLQWNKNATAGEGGLLVTQDAGLYERLVAAHDLGVPWGPGGPTLERPKAITWGAGRRLGELAGAVASVQFKKLPRIVAHMRRSKARIKRMLADVPGLEFRRLNDEAGDTGAFLILVLPTADQAMEVSKRLQQAGLSFACMLDHYGMHIYYRIPQLVQQVPLSPAGNPWSLPANRPSRPSYVPGTCPRSDALFARSILLPIPSRLTPAQEKAGALLIREAVLQSG